MALATGTVLFRAQKATPPTANAGGRSWVVSTHTQPFVMEFLSFQQPSVAVQYWDFPVFMHPLYTGESFNLYLDWLAKTAITGNIAPSALFWRMATTVTLTGAPALATAQVAAAVTASGTANRLKRSTIGFTSAQIDGWLASEPAMLRVSRPATGDTMADIAHVLLQSIVGVVQ